MNAEDFLTQLHTTCAEAITEYRTQFLDHPPLSERLRYDSDTPFASEADLHRCFQEFIQIYDDLFEVDSTPYRNQWRDHLVYDVSRREHLRLMASDPPSSLMLVWIGGRYAGSTGHIGVSTGRLPVPRAYSLLASELLHAYQDCFDSPTGNHPYLQEGMDRAASAQALAQLPHTLDEDNAVAHAANRQRAKALLAGTLAHGTRHGGITPASVRDLGVTTDELSALQAALPWRVLGRVQPRYRWGSVAFLPNYDLFGSLLLVSETMGVSDTYSRAFWGDHPWDELIADIQSIKPGWLWRYYHRPKTNRL
ncbi:hypothetical protein [Halorussus amylolyticus]|uniref:hypothetical protein n=1 Tax=Halorussus amylolyticus TaxID=1126242 RepID=UPI001053801C|nr:hypothetical protein [Halorussus amylolyticus]